MRPQVPDRPLSRVLHLHQACMDHPFGAGRRCRTTAPSQGPSGARFSRSVPSIPALMSYRLRHSSVASALRRRSMFNQEDVGPRTPVQLHWAGVACCPGKGPLPAGILQLVLLDGRVAGGAHRGLLPCDVDLKVRGGERNPLLRAETRFPGARLRRIAARPIRRVGEELVRSDLPLREPVNDRTLRRGGHLHVGDELGGVRGRSPPPAPRWPL